MGRGGGRKRSHREEEVSVTGEADIQTTAEEQVIEEATIIPAIEEENIQVFAEPDVQATGEANIPVIAEVSEDIRIRHDLYRRVTNTDIDIGNVLLTKSSTEVGFMEYMAHKDYFDELRVLEQQRQVYEISRLAARREADRQENEARREAKVLVLTRKLNHHYSTTDAAQLCQIMPGAVFTSNGSGGVSKEAVLAAARGFFANHPTQNADTEARRIWNIINGREQVEAAITDDTPDFSINNHGVLVVNDAQSEFYPFKYIFVRQCYLDLFPKIMRTAQNTVVALVGDRGIGKSTFLRYLFVNIIANHPQKVFWEMESGNWRYFDGQTRISGFGETDLWTKPDVLLLLDGNFKPIHLSKTKKVVLFCSPQQGNYDRMIKASLGAIFVMPCWDIEEVKSFINITVETRSEGGAIVSKNILSENMKFFYDDLRSQVASVPRVLENPSDIPLETYDENEAILRLDEVNFLKMEVMKRFELVGGRIRLLLHNYTGFSQLKEQVLKSVYAVSAKDLEQLDCLDLHHHAPSIIYSFVPNDILTNPKKYRLHFASDYIAKHVASRIVLHFKGEINNLFAALKDQKVGGSLVGQIFEYLVLEALQSGKIRYISGTRLRPTPPLMDSEPDVTIEFGAIDILKYNVSSRDLRRLISGGARLNKLLLPIQLNAPSVDAVFYNAQTRRYYFIQITISIDHPINYLQIAKLANALGVTNYTLIDIIYLVPQNVYYNFKIQKVANAPARGYTGFNQYVFRVADINNAGLSILNYVSSN